MPQERTAFDGQQLERMEVCLQKLLTKSKAVVVLLADIEGQTVGQVGTLSDKDRTALSTLAAGSFAATAAMARILGQTGAFDQLFFEGDKYSVYASAVGDEFLLTVAFGTGAKPGLVRLLAQEAIWELFDVIRQAQTQGVEQAVEDLIDVEFAESLADELDALFGDMGTDAVDA